MKNGEKSFSRPGYSGSNIGKNSNRILTVEFQRIRRGSVLSIDLFRQTHTGGGFSSRVGKQLLCFFRSLARPRKGFSSTKGLISRFHVAKRYVRLRMGQSPRYRTTIPQPRNEPREVFESREPVIARGWMEGGGARESERKESVCYIGRPARCTPCSPSPLYRIIPNKS